MDKGQLNKIALSFFDKDEDLKVIYATEQGHFFYTKDGRAPYLNRNRKDKAVDIYRDGYLDAKKIEDDKPVGGTPMPDIIPGYEELIEHGFTTLEEVINEPRLAKAVKGVGDATERQIKEFIKNL